MTDRRRNLFVLLVVAGLLAASVFAIATKTTRLGLDLRGGVELVYEAKPTPQQPVVDQASLDRAIDVMRDRFGIQHRLEPYALEDLAAIVRRSARILDVELEDDGARAIAARSRGTPRVANRLLRRVRDYAEVRMGGVVTAEAADRALALLEVDERGLDRLDRDILEAICVRFDGGPVGLSTLAVAVGEEADTIEDVYEPYLLQQGLLKRTPRGRTATAAAFRHLGLEPATLL